MLITDTGQLGDMVGYEFGGHGLLCLLLPADMVNVSGTRCLSVVFLALNERLLGITVVEFCEQACPGDKDNLAAVLVGFPGGFPSTE